MSATVTTGHYAFTYTSIVPKVMAHQSLICSGREGKHKFEFSFTCLVLASEARKIEATSSASWVWCVLDYAAQFRRVRVTKVYCTTSCVG